MSSHTPQRMINSTMSFFTDTVPNISVPRLDVNQSKQIIRDTTSFATDNLIQGVSTSFNSLSNFGYSAFDYMTINSEGALFGNTTSGTKSKHHHFDPSLLRQDDIENICTLALTPDDKTKSSKFIQHHLEPTAHKLSKKSNGSYCFKALIPDFASLESRNI